MAKVDPKEIPWDVIIPEVVKALTPFIQGIAWLGLSQVDKRANALNNLIAIGEVIPTIDLGLPRGVVLAALYDKTGDSLDMLNQLVQALKDIPGDLKEYVKDTVDETKEEIVETILDPITENEAVIALGDCRANAKKNLKWFYGANIQTYLWIQSCLGQKGFSVGVGWVKDKL